MQQQLHDNESKQASAQVINHDSGAFGKVFQLAYRGWLKGIERSKKYKAHKKRFPTHRGCDESNQLSRDFVDDDKLRIFKSGRARHESSGGNSDRDREQGQGGRGQRVPRYRNGPAEEPPQSHGRGRAKGSGSGTTESDAKKGGC